MKKTIVTLAIIVFVTILFFNLRIDAQKKQNNIQIENIDALACISVIGSEGSLFETFWCCPPWMWDCHWNSMYDGIPGFYSESPQ
jgi:hypothetical protein